MSSAQDGTYVITGVKGNVFPRLEIRDLQSKQPEQFTLFILGWQAIREQNYVPVAARHVQIGGIHGKPYERWPGDPKGNSSHATQDDWEGYCHHASVLFPVWHRPYVLALEQSIGEAAANIANGFATQYPNEANKWKDAAKALRFPFWDWTLPITGTEGLPTVLRPGKLKLAMPNGSTQEIDNILAHYDFGTKLPNGFTDVNEENPLVPDGAKQMAYYKEWKRTYRWPESKPNNPSEDYDAIDKILTAQDVDPESGSPARGSWKDLINNVANIFKFPIDAPSTWYPHIWDRFSNTTFESGKPPPGPTPTDVWDVTGPLEHPHNTVHLVIGGIGYMGDNDYAGFDPIFFLHHCNVDRLFALWEYVYPKYWMGEGYMKGTKLVKFTEPSGTWSEKENYPIDEHTVQDPFRKDVTTYWNSNDTRFLNNMATQPKYYTYPPVAGVQVDKPATDADRAKYLAALQQYFGMDPFMVLDKAGVTFNPPIFTDPAKDQIPQNHEAVDGFRHFVLQVELLEFAFNMSYSIEFVYTNGQGREVSVGSVPVLGKGNLTTQCGNCQGRRANHNKIKSCVTIDTDIVADILTKENVNNVDATDQDVIHALKRNIRAYLITAGGAVIASASHGSSPGAGGGLPAGSIPKIKIVSTNVAHPKHQRGTGPLAFYAVADHGEHLEQNWSKA